MTILEFVNKCFFQLLFVRLVKHSVLGNTVAWSFMYWVIPFTGWDNKYMFTRGGQRFYYIIKR